MKVIVLMEPNTMNKIFVRHFISAVSLENKHNHSIIECSCNKQPLNSSSTCITAFVVCLFSVHKCLISELIYHRSQEPSKMNRIIISNERVFFFLKYNVSVLLTF